MKTVTYIQIAEIANLIKNKILSRFFPGELIPSERKMALELNISHNKIHRAVQMLVKEGILNSSGCRRGIRLCKFSQNQQPRLHREKVKLKFAMPISGELFQVKVWQRVCNSFCAAYPEVEIEIINNVDPNRESEDLNLVWPPFLNKDLFTELKKEEIFTDGLTENDFIPGIMETGCQFGKFLAVPIMHTPGVFWGHRNMLHRMNLDVRNFNDPLDFFRWGNTLGNTNLCAMGFFFYGFSYHAAHYGLGCQRKNGKFYMEPDKLYQFFGDIKDLVHAINIAYSAANYFTYFHRGQLALNANYLSALPIDNLRFQMLGQPLKPDGFACQALFYLAIGAKSKNRAAALEFIRFVLEKNIQRMFFFKEIKFSVHKELYAEQYQELSAQVPGFIPPFDIRGTTAMTDLDYALPVGRYLYMTCADYLCNFMKLDIAVERIQCIDIHEIRHRWWENLPDNNRIIYRDYRNSWK